MASNQIHVDRLHDGAAHAHAHARARGAVGGVPGAPPPQGV